MQRRPTAKDVADLAGVSRSAVSMVLNGRAEGNIAPDKQLAVREAAEKLGYTPDSVARSLRLQRTQTVGVVTDAIATSPFGGRLLEGAVAAAERHGYVLVVMDTHFDAAREEGAYRTLVDRRVDALLYAAMSYSRYRSPEVLQRAPSALANCIDSAGAVLGFVPDEVAGAAAAAQVLVDAGHRDVVLLAGDQRNETYDDLLAVPRREAGYRRALEAACVRWQEPVRGGWEVRPGYEAALAVLQRDDRPTALLCANDRVAAGAVLAACHLGLRVPQDVSIVGYDDDENFAAPMVPPLTTVRLPFREMGERALEHVLGLLADPEAPAPEGVGRGLDDGEIAVALDCPLVERGSVAPPSR